MKTSITKVVKFHEAFGVYVAQAQGFPRADDTAKRCLARFSGALGALSKNALDLCAAEQATGGNGLLLMRAHLMMEELGECLEAMAAGDLQEALDALCDMRYVNDGTAVTLGLHPVFDPAFGEVHDSNMSKLDPEGRPIYGPGERIVKGPNYHRPDLGQFIEET